MTRKQYLRIEREVEAFLSVCRDLCDIIKDNPKPTHAYRRKLKKFRSFSQRLMDWKQEMPYEKEYIDWLYRGMKLKKHPYAGYMMWVADMTMRQLIWMFESIYAEPVSHVFEPTMPPHLSGRLRLTKEKLPTLPRVLDELYFLSRGRQGPWVSFLDSRRTPR